MGNSCTKCSFTTQKSPSFPVGGYCHDGSGHLHPGAEGEDSHLLCGVPVWPQLSALSGWIHHSILRLPWLQWCPQGERMPYQSGEYAHSGTLSLHPVLTHHVWLDPLYSFLRPSRAVVASSRRICVSSEWWICTFRDTVFTSCTHAACLAGSITHFSLTFLGCGGTLKENLCFLRVVSSRVHTLTNTVFYIVHFIRVVLGMLLQY